MPLRTFLASRRSARPSQPAESAIGWRRRKLALAHRVEIRRPVSWLHRALWVMAVAGIALAGGYGLFVFGQRSAGYDSWASGQRIDAVEAENTRLHDGNQALLTSSREMLTQLQIERGARQALETQVLRLEEERARLGRDLALFENLFPASGVDGVPEIRGFRVEPVVAEGGEGTWRYRVLVMRGGDPKDDFQGEFKLLARYRLGSRELAATTATDGRISEALQFRRYQRIEGQFQAPKGGVLLGAVAKVEENGRPVSESVFRK